MPVAIDRIIAPCRPARIWVPVSRFSSSPRESGFNPIEYAAKKRVYGGRNSVRQVAGFRAQYTAQAIQTVLFLGRAVDLAQPNHAVMCRLGCIVGGAQRVQDFAPIAMHHGDAQIRLLRKMVVDA